ncbi:MAG: ABC transporter substrate-binding protein [Clostridiales bacterium]|jgi:peptide/nickel transport system substrate-binding protein|nr:ABC transporter substrate-binding protein [Clostridiales bacterium]
MKRTLAIISAFVIGLTLLAGCGQKAGAGEITVVLSEVGNNLDPSIANYTDTSSIMSHVYDNIINVDSKFELIAGAAASWEQPDSVTIELTMGEGFVFHNGEPMEIEDLEYALGRLENVPEMASTWGKIESLSSNGNVVTITLKEPDNSFLRGLSAIPVLDKSYCESAGEAYANTPIGTGPYKVAEYVPGERVVLQAWDEYPFEKAGIGKLTYKGISETAAKYMAVEAGDAQFSGISYSDYQRAQSNSAISTYEGPSTRTAFVCMNTSAAPFDNVNVRMAMALAYNKEGYMALSANNDFVIDSMFTPGTVYHNSSQYAINYDLDKARELLTAEGYDESNPLEFIVAGYSGDDPVMQAYQADLASIGVKVTLENYEFGTFLNLMMNQEYQMLTGSWSEVTGDPLSAAACYWTGSYGEMNIAFYDNPKCDELYETAKTSADEAEIIACCRELQDIAWQEVPLFPTYGRYADYAYDTALTGVDIHPSGIISFRAAKYSK